MSRFDWNIPDERPRPRPRPRRWRGGKNVDRVGPGLTARIDAYLDGELSADEAARLLREISRRPAAFARLSKDQAWIDSLAVGRHDGPDLTRTILARVGADSSVTSRTSRVMRVIRRLSAAAAIVVGLSLTMLMRPEPEAPLSTPVSAPFVDPIGAIPSEAAPEFRFLEFVEHAVNQVRNLAEERPQVLPAVEYRRGPVDQSPIAPAPHRWLSDPLQSTPTRLELPADLDLPAVGPMGFV